MIRLTSVFINHFLLFSFLQGDDTFQRCVYAGNAVQTFKLTNPTKFLSFRATSFDATASSSANVSDVETIDADSLIVNKSNLATHMKDEISKSERPELTSARFVYISSKPNIIQYSLGRNNN